MSGSGKKRSTLELGHDSFLDIVANLVGILIILVVVLGTQSTAVIEEINEQQIEDLSGDRLASDEQLAALAQQSMRAAAAQADSDRLEQTVLKYQILVEGRNRQRAMLLDLLAQAKASWEEKKKELDEQATEQARLASRFDRAAEKLALLKGQRQRLEEQPEQIVAVAHLPTPMAKTVFGDELHFRLKDNRLSVVPVDQLLDEIRLDFQRVAAGPRNGLMDAAVGPIRGYVARYEMAKNREMVSQGGRIGLSTRIQLVGMKVEPLSEPHGQPIEKVLSGSSELDIELAGRDPGSTSITVWVYPDSFASFRKLKELLYSQGFATAGRPLPMDQPITGSPHGSRSRAQ